MPKVSVIIPIYKVEKYIERCTCSLFEQTLEDMEFIFVDDCSPDSSVSVVKSLVNNYPIRKKQVKYLSHEKNKGLCAARNTGLSVATGDYIAYCDSDDWVDLKMYEKLYDYAVEKDADLCFCNFNFVFADRLETYKCTPVFRNKHKTINSYIETTWTVIWNMIVKRNIYRDNFINFPEGISYCEDFGISVRLLFFAEKIVKVDEALYFYNQMNVDSVMHLMNKQYEHDCRKIYLDTICFFKKHDVYKKYKKTMCWRLLHATCDSAVCFNHYKEFVALYPDWHIYYIWSCPYNINIKSRIIMSLLTFYPLRFIGVFLVWLRNLLQR